MSRPPLPEARQRQQAWHRAECWSYTADLPYWRQLATESPGPCLDLGCGTGRVSRDLATRGHSVIALDHDPDLLAAVDHPKIHTVRADLREFELGQRFDLILAPMQLLQLLTELEARLDCLERIRHHLSPGGRFALATLDFEPEPDQIGPELIANRDLEPDRAEMPGGYVACSLPSSGHVNRRYGLELHRQRWLEVEAEPGVRLAEESASVTLALLNPERLGQELTQAGLSMKWQTSIPATAAHMASFLTVATPASATTAAAAVE